MGEEDGTQRIELKSCLPQEGWLQCGMLLCEIGQIHRLEVDGDVIVLCGGGEEGWCMMSRQSS
jgi:hypothetical protein